jgi:hypothetical protein
MTKSNTNKSAAPTRILPGTASLLLAAVVALEVTGMQALSHGHGRWDTTAAANGDTIYTQVEATGASASDVVAQAAY